MVPGLEVELAGELEDTGIERAGGVAEGSGVEAEGVGSATGGAGGSEVGVVEHVEGFHAELEVEALMDGEDTADREVDVVVSRRAEGVAADGAEGSNGVLGEGCLVEVSEIGAGALDVVVGVRIGAGNQVGAIQIDAGAGVIRAGGDVEGLTGDDANERSYLPVVGQCTANAVQRREVAGGDEGGVEDVVHIEAAGSTVEAHVVGVLILRSRDVAGSVGDVRALGPGVVGQEAEVAGHAVLDGGDHAVVAGGAVVGDQRHGWAVALPLGIAGQGKRRTRIGVAGGGAGITSLCRIQPVGGRRSYRNANLGHALAGPGSGPGTRDVDRGVDAATKPLVCLLAAKVVERKHPSTAEVLLNTGGPLIDDGSLHVALQQDPEGVCGEGGCRVGREDSGEWVATGVIAPGLVKGNIWPLEIDLVDEGWVGGNALRHVERRGVVHHGSAGAEDGLTGAEGIEGEADTRRDVAEPVAGEGLGNAGVAVIEGSSGSIREFGGVLTRIEGRPVKGGTTAKLVGLVEVRLPTEAVVDGKGGSDVPGVLGVETEDVLAVGGVLGTALAEGAHLAGEEVCQGLTGGGAVAAEGIAAVEEVAGAGVVTRADKFSTKGNLVLADEPVNIVGKILGVHVEVAGGAGSATGIEAASHLDTQIDGGVGKDVDAKGVGVDTARRRPTVVAAAGVGPVEGVDDLRRDDEGVAEGKALNALVVTGGSGEQDVGRRVVVRSVVVGEVVAAEEGVALAPGVVDAADVLVFGVVAGKGHADEADGVGLRERKHFDEVERGGAELRGGDLFAWIGYAGEGVLEGCRGGGLGAVAAGGHPAEVAIEHGRRWDAVVGCAGGFMLACALIAAEEEELVGDDLAAEGSAELIALDGVLGGGEEVGGVDDVVADEVEDGAVPLVGAGVGDGVDERARVDTVACGQRVGFDGELVQRVGEGIGQVDVGEVVGVVSAVEDVVVVVALASGDGDDGGAGVVLGADHVVAGRGDGTAGDEDELGSLTTVERHLGNAGLVDDLFEGAGLGLEGYAGGLHVNVLACRADLKVRIDGDAVTNLEHTGLIEGLEALRGDAERVGADGDVRHGIDASGVGLRDTSNSGRGLLEGYGRISNGGPGGIGDGALNAGGACGLCPGLWKHHEWKEKQAQE